MNGMDSTDRATIFFITEWPSDADVPLRGIYLTDRWHGPGFHRRAVKELQHESVRRCWNHPEQLVRIMCHRLMMALASQNEPADMEMSTKPPEVPTFLPVLVIDTSDNTVLVQPEGMERARISSRPIEQEEFCNAHTLDLGEEEDDE